MSAHGSHPTPFREWAKVDAVSIFIVAIVLTLAVYGLKQLYERHDQFVHQPRTSP